MNATIMKKIYLMLALPVLLLSCNKQDPAAGKAAASDAGECLLTVSLSDGHARTKIASQSAVNETVINNVQVFVFRAGDGPDSGMLDVCASAGFPNPLVGENGNYGKMKLKCSAGTREIWAVVNDAADHTAKGSGVSNRNDLLALTTELKDNASTRLFMIGSTTEELRSGSAEVSVKVKRVCASVILESVTNDFIAPSYQATGMFRVKDCFLMNVPAMTNFGQTVEAASLTDPKYWYARMAAETASPQKDLIFDRVDPSVEVNYGSDCRTVHTFYSYPNNCGFSRDNNWSPRATMLVVEAELKNGPFWDTYYYPVVFESLESNKQYRVNLTVKRPGSTDPNDPVEFTDMIPVITVEDWESGESYNPEI